MSVKRLDLWENKLCLTLETAYKERHKLCHTRYVLAKPIVVPLFMCFFGIFYLAYWVSYYSQSVCLINQNVMTISFILWIMQNYSCFILTRVVLKFPGSKGKLTSMVSSTAKCVGIFVVSLSFVVFLDIVLQSRILNINSQVSLQIKHHWYFPATKNPCITAQSSFYN